MKFGHLGGRVEELFAEHLDEFSLFKALQVSLRQTSFHYGIPDSPLIHYEERWSLSASEPHATSTEQVILHYELRQGKDFRSDDEVSSHAAKVLATREPIKLSDDWSERLSVGRGSCWGSSTFFTYAARFEPDRFDPIRKLNEGKEGYIHSLLIGEEHVFIRGDWLYTASNPNQALQKEFNQVLELMSEPDAVFDIFSNIWTEGHKRLDAERDN